MNPENPRLQECGTVSKRERHYLKVGSVLAMTRI